MKNVKKCAEKQCETKVKRIEDTSMKKMRILRIGIRIKWKLTTWGKNQAAVLLVKEFLSSQDIKNMA